MELETRMQPMYSAGFVMKECIDTNDDFNLKVPKQQLIGGFFLKDYSNK